MPDISMCKSPVNCPKQNNCHRFTAKPDRFMQSYTDFQCDGKCDYFWDNKNYDNE